MTKPNEIAQYIIGLEQAWANAMQARDLSELNRLVADDFFVTIAAQGLPLQVTQRERWLASMPNYEIREMSLDDIHAHVYGDVAVVTLLWTQRAFVNGGERSGTFFITDIWRSIGNEWRVAERHSSRPEPASAARPV